jgi:hypothetical protein
MNKKQFRKVVKKILEVELQLEDGLLDYSPAEQKQARKDLKELFQGVQDIDDLIQVMEDLGYDQKITLLRVIEALTA